MSDAHIDSARPDFLPAADYRDPARHRAELDRLWPRVWQMACRESDLAHVGAFVRYDIVDDSILVVKTGDGADDVVAYYNVCQHRGRRLKEDWSGTISTTLACRFHGWQWHINGDLHSVYVPEDWDGCPEMDSASLGLPKVKVGRWGGWVWINQDPDCEPLADYLGSVPQFLDPFEPENMRPLWWKTIIAPVNWKIVIEAFNEGYHSWATHASGVNYRNSRSPGIAHGLHSMFYSESVGPGEFKDPLGKWRLPKSTQEYIWANNNHLFNTLGALALEPGMAANNRLLELPADTPSGEVVATMFRFYAEEFEKRGVTFPPNLTIENWAKAGTDWHIFPHSICLPSLDGALWYRLRPNGHDPDSCIFDIWSLGRFKPGAEPKVVNDIYEGFDAFRGQCAFLEEDFANMEAVHQGVKSRGFRGARTNPRQEVPVINFHRALAEFTRS
jgi:phenylpropionate dioxygenase-like ring-hydroxylating dioxygenase large terminal subunit